MANSLPLVWLLCLAAMLVGAPIPVQAQSSAPLRVFAAASLKTALDNLAAPAARHIGRPVQLVYGASSQLARQIEQGAPADIFFSADTDWMNEIAVRNLLLPGSRIDLLGNRLVVIVPARSPVNTLTLTPEAIVAALGDRGRLALGEKRAVPAGRYAKAALIGIGVWNSVADRLVMADTARAALMFVARGEAPLGIVYASDAVAEPNVRVVAQMPEQSHPPIVYPAAVLARSSPDAAQAGRAFIAFLRMPEAAGVFTANHFSLLTGD